MKVLVTGASGFLGREVVRCLCEDGFAVTAFLRPSVDVAEFGPSRPAIAVGDITHPSSIQVAAEGHDAIVHCAALVGQVAEAEADRVNVTGSRNVARAAQIAGVSHLVHISSVAVYGGPGLGPPRTEQSALIPGDAYGQSKLRSEEAMRQEISGGMKLTILRPAGLYGPGRELYRRWLEKLQHRKFRVDLSGSEIVHPCHVRDLGRVISSALRKSSPAGEVAIYNVAGEKPLSLAELRDLLVRYSEFDIRIMTIPRWVARPMVRLMAEAGHWPEQRRAITLAMAAGLFPGAVYDTAKAERELDVRWTSLADGLREMVEGFRTRDASE